MSNVTNAPLGVGWCHQHNMWLFESRKAAKRAGKRKFPGDHYDAFMCRDGFWHYVEFRGKR